MKKRFVIIICMSVIFATCWGCESGNSKVDQVLQNQAQGGDSQQIDASRQAEDSQQGIEFELKDDLKYPDDYPELGTDVVITGDFDTYSEGDKEYCILRNAIME